MMRSRCIFARPSAHRRLTFTDDKESAAIADAGLDEARA